MEYILSKMSVLGCFLCVIGAIFTIQGIIVRYNLTNIKESYSRFEIRNGRYIEYDISKEDLIGRYYTERNGVIKYSAVCNTDALSSTETYLVTINEDSDCYVPLVVVRKYQKDFKKMLNSDDTYHLLGKFEKSPDIVIYYEAVAECLGLDDRSKLDQILSTNHQITIVDLEDEKKILYKGLALIIIGLIIILSTLEIGKKRLDIESSQIFII